MGKLYCLITCYWDQDGCSCHPKMHPITFVNTAVKAQVQTVKNDKVLTTIHNN
jgi:hypothetical protein